MGGEGGGERGERNACYKGPYWFISAVADGRKILIGNSDNRSGFSRAFLLRYWKTIKMAAEIDMLARALADLNVVARSEFKLKPEQEVAVKSLLDGKNVLAVLPTGYGKSLIYQMFVRAKNFEMNGKAKILVISPLVSIIKDQILDMKSIGYSAVDSREMTISEIRKCNFKLLYLTAEKFKEKAFREMLIDPNSPLNQNICAVVIDESHTVETWTGKR